MIGVLSGRVFFCIPLISYTHRLGFFTEYDKSSDMIHFRISRGTLAIV